MAPFDMEAFKDFVLKLKIKATDGKSLEKPGGNGSHTWKPFVSVAQYSHTFQDSSY